MNKLTQYIYITFFAAVLFIGFIVNTPNLYLSLHDAMESYSYDAISIITQNSFEDHIFGKYGFVECNGLVNRILGRHRMNQVVKLQNGKLVTTVPYAEVNGAAQKTIDFYTYLEQQDIPFVYVQNPYEICDIEGKLPEGIEDYSNENARRFLQLLEENGVPYLDIHSMMHEENINHYDAYFQTDHHWRAETAFWAFTKITDYTEGILDVKIPDAYTSLDSYQTTILAECMLGSNGRKTGIVYSGQLDDLAIITPTFDVDACFAVEDKDIFRQGSYEEAYLVSSRLEGDSLYEMSQYDIYIGGEYGEANQICNTAPCEKRILIIKDSYARPVMAFMGTVFSQVDSIDMRYFDGNVYEYVEETKPDMVILMYNPYMLLSTDNFEFQKETDAEVAE